MNEIDDLILKLENCLNEDQEKIDDLVEEISKISLLEVESRVPTCYIEQKYCKFLLLMFFFEQCLSCLFNLIKAYQKLKKN